MDLLDRVMAPASDLLDRVDDLLVRHGAPRDHPVWALIRRVEALPGSALADVATLAPERIRAAVAPLATSADDCQTAVAVVPLALDAQGVAASAFANRWSDMRGQIVDDRDSLGVRLDETAAYLRAVADWAATARRDLATTLAGCLGSAEAVAVRSASLDVEHHATLAAADIGAHVLGEVAQAIEAGWQVRQDWAHIAEETPVRTATKMTVDLSGHIDVR